ncbi:MAG: HYR domain-containing protein, partial [Acidobacteria bacterium]|nr:HYR domain-containing protein [Acidobacteriota bacterium]
MLCSTLVFGVVGAISFYSASSASSAQRLDVSAMLNRMPGAAALRPAQIAPSETIDTFAANCATPKNTFVLGNTVCAQAVGAPAPFLGVKQRRFQWVAPDGSVARLSDITTDPANDSYTIPTTGAFAQPGTWAVRTIKNNGSVASLTRFVVRDPNNARVDLNVIKTGPLDIKAGGNASYQVTIENRGPDDAQNVTLTDDVPANMTFLSDTQNSGDTFNCTDPSVGGGGTITCTLGNLASGDSATFTFIYQVSGAAQVGSSIENTATVSSQTVDIEPANNSATTHAGVTGTTGGNQCVIDCPADIIVPHDAGQASAIVNFPSPTTSGSNCGSVSCSRASGSSFPVGTTTVVCSPETGDECSFAVTVEDNVNPTISCPSDINTAEDTEGSGIATVTYTTPAGSDDSGTVFVTCDHPSGSGFPVGTTTVTCTAADAGGNEASCSFDVHVTGTGACELSCPQNIVVDINSGCGTIVNYPAPTATSCGTVTSSPASGTFFNVGVTTVTVTSTAGHTCEFTVTVREHTPPS